MYIDEKLIEILEPYKGETIDFSYVISLIKTVALENETEQCTITFKDMHRNFNDLNK